MERRQTALAVALTLALAISPAYLFAQRGGMGGRSSGGRGGFAARGSGHVSGNPRGAVAFRGGFHQGCFGCFGHGGFGHHGVHFGRGVGFGFGHFHRGFFPPAFAPFGFGFPGFVPVFPVFPSTTVVVVPGYMPYGYGGYYADPPPDVAYQSAPQSNYVVASGSAGPVASTPRLILLAFQDHSIYAAVDYWVQDDTLFYTTSYGARNQAPVNALDLDLTVQLNRERGINFSLDARRIR